MIDFIDVLIKNSITMSFFIAIYIILLRVFFKNTKAKWNYYSWLIIVFGLMIPARPDIHVTLDNNSFFARLLDLRQAIPETIVSGRAATNTENKVFFSLWVLGLTIFAIYHLLKHRNFLKLVKRWSRKIKDPEILDVLTQVQNDLKINHAIQLMSCSVINTPMMVGFLKPKIILPDQNNKLGETQYILKHELIHLKRKDIWYKCLVFFVSALNWFNPFVYLMAREISVQCELSCDEEVMKDACYDQRKNYSTILLSVIKKQCNAHSLFITNFYGTKDIVKERMVSLLNMKKKRVGIITSGFLIIGIFLTGITFSLKTNSVDINMANRIVPNEASVSDDRHEETNSAYADEESIPEKASPSESSQEELVYENLLSEKYFEITGGYILVPMRSKVHREITDAALSKYQILDDRKDRIL